MTHEPVAIVGLAALFPQARTVGEFWSNVLGNVDCIEETPASRWRREEYFDPDPSIPDKTYCTRGGFVPAVDLDPLEFGLPPRRLDQVDTSQLLSLLVARDALADAGYDGASKALPSERTGVVLGVAGTTIKLLSELWGRLQYPVWRRALRESGVDEARVEAAVQRLSSSYVGWTEDAFPGFLANVVAGRIAGRLDLGGVTCSVDAACASSLCAVRMAAAELASGNCDVMIAGGVDTDNSITAFMSFSKTPALSQRQRVRPFDAEADGTMISEGIGMVVLKRLSDARRDGDRIYAHLLAVGASSDGRSKSIYAPRASGQARALRLAYAQAGVAPASIGLVEAHGTGTPVGDEAEIESLCAVLEEDGAGVGTVALGSVKSQIGHTKAAAGIASLIKAALALHQQVLPPTLGIAQPHPALAGSPLVLNTASRPWLREDLTVPRRAGVSAFGFGGTNYHAVLEEPSGGAWHRLAAVPQPVLLAAPDEAQLATRCADIAASVTAAADPGEALATLAAASRSLDLPADAARLGFVAQTGAELAELLDAACTSFASQRGAARWHHPRGVWFARSGAVQDGVAVIFPGQGSQYVGMGSALTLSFPELRSAWERLDAAFEAAGHERLSAVALGRPGAPGVEDRLRRTLFAQGSVGAVSMGTYALLAAAGLRPRAAIGHSFGELTALWAAGSLTDAEFASLVTLRGGALTPPGETDAGGMLAVRGAPAAEVEAALPAGVVVANLNSPSQVVVAGPRAALAVAEEALQARGWTARRLPVAAAFHTDAVEYAREPWRRALDAMSPRPPAFTVYANATGAPYPPSDGAAMLDLLAAQPFCPVQFARAVEDAWAGGCRVFVECGPGSVLTRLVDDILADREHVAVAVDGGRGSDDDLGLRQAWVRLRVAGVRLSAIDPYVQDAPARAPVSAVSVRVDAAGVVGPDREDAPADVAPVVVAPAEVTPPEVVSSSVAPAEVTPPEAVPSSVAPAEVAPSPVAPAEVAPSPAAPLVEDVPAGRSVADPTRVEVAVSRCAAADDVHALRAATVEAHREYVGAHAQRARALVELAGRQLALPPCAAGERASVDRALAALTEHEADLLRVHEQYLRDEAQLAQGLLELAGAPPALAPAPVPEEHGAAPALAPAPEEHGATPALAPAPSEEDAADLVLRVVAERTGYPAEFLELGMELEGDLGIDSIKRVEILAQLREAVGSTTRPDGDVVRGVRTLADVAALVVALRSDVVAAPPPVAAPPSVASTGTMTPQPVAPLSDLGPDVGMLQTKDLAPRADRGPDIGTLRTKHLAPPVALDVALPQGHVALISSDGSPLTAALAHALERLGLVPVVLIPPADVVRAPTDLADDQHQVLLRDLDDAFLKQTLARVTATFGPVAVHVHLHPQVATAAGHRALLRNVMLRAKHLQPQLTLDTPPGRRAFLTAARLDGKLGTGGEHAIEPLAGACFGLVATLAREWPGTHCRAIDLGPGEDDDPQGAAARIVQELLDPDATLTAVGHSDAERVTLVYEPRPAAPAAQPDPLTAGDVVVATGGARGVTAACVIELARRARCRFVLVGRTALEPEEPAWAAGCPDRPALLSRAAAALAEGEPAAPRAVQEAVDAVLAQREVRLTLRAVADAGGEARYVAADVADRDALAAGLATATTGWGPVSAVVHGAGAVADRLIEHKTGADFDAVFGPKVDGLHHLLDALDTGALRRVALFGSVAGVAGNCGQADYAMANAVLDRSAHELARRLAPSCRVVALDWGPWDGGMVTPELRERFASRGVDTIALADGARVLADELTRAPGSPAQVLVGPAPPAPGSPSPSLLLRLCLTEHDLAALDGHRVAGRPVVPAAWAAAWLAGAAELLRPDLRLVSIDDFRVLKGVVVDGRLVVLAIAVREVQRAPGESVLEATLAGRDPDSGAERPHFSATIRLADAAPARVRIAAPDVASQVAGAEALHRSGPIAYGPAFATVRRVCALEASRVVTECQLPDAPARPPAPASAAYDAALADVATHGILVWLARFHDAACLPTHTARSVVYGAPPPGAPVFVTLEVDAIDDSSVAFGYAVHDRDGLVFARAEGLKMMLLLAGDGGDADAASAASLAGG